MGQSKKQVYETIFEVEGFHYFFRYYTNRPGDIVSEADGITVTQGKKVDRLAKAYRKAAQELEDYLRKLGLDEDLLYGELENS